MKYENYYFKTIFWTEDEILGGKVVSTLVYIYILYLNIYHV